MDSLATSTGSKRKRRRLSVAALALVALAAHADPKLLPPEEAFRFSARALDDRTLEARFSVTDGYYLYRDKMKFALDPDMNEIAVALPAGKVKEDQFFGKVETYRGDVVVRVPLAQPASGKSVVLVADSQGCADAGVCYPATRQKVTLAIPDAGKGPGRRRRSLSPQEELVQLVPMRNRLRWTVLGVAAAVALAAGVYFGLERAAPGSSSAQAAAALAGLALPDPGGKEQRLDQWRGKVVVVNFWATWCAPCREEMPEFIKAQQQYGPKGLQFVGIAVDQADKVEQFAKEIGLNYPALIGGFGAMELSKTLGNNLMALPFTVVLDRKGAVIHTQLGELKPAKLQSIITQLL